MDLFFVAERQKTHISVDVSEHARGSDIVKVIAGVTGTDPSQIKLKHATDDARTKWDVIEADNALSTYGFTKETAKSEAPVHLAYILPEDGDSVKIEDKSAPEDL